MNEAGSVELTLRPEQFQSVINPLIEDFRDLNPQTREPIRQNSILTVKTSRLARPFANNLRSETGETSNCVLAGQVSLVTNDYPDMRVNVADCRTVIVSSEASISAFLEAQ